jgi:hypothetical protein
MVPIEMVWLGMGSGAMHAICVSFMVSVGGRGGEDVMCRWNGHKW